MYLSLGYLCRTLNLNFFSCVPPLLTFILLLWTVLSPFQCNSSICYSNAVIIKTIFLPVSGRKKKWLAKKRKQKKMQMLTSKFYLNIFPVQKNHSLQVDPLMASSMGICQWEILFWCWFVGIFGTTKAKNQKFTINEFWWACMQVNLSLLSAPLNGPRSILEVFSYLEEKIIDKVLS